MDLICVCSVTNGQSQVNRVSGDVWENLLPGALLTVAGFNTSYAVAAILTVPAGQTPNTLFLTDTFGGLTNANANVRISIDFTPNKNLPLINVGDIAAASLYNRAMNIMDEESLSVLPEHGPTHRPKGSDSIPYTDSNDGGIWPQVTGNPSDVLTGDVACTSIGLVINRAYNAVGNPTMEVDQKLAGAIAVPAPPYATFTDRWGSTKTGTMALTVQRVVANSTAAGGIVYPGSTNILTNSYLRATVTTAQAGLLAGDFLFISQLVEGSRMRELLGPHSIQLVVRCSVANTSFSMTLRDPNGSRSLTQLCNVPAANVWTTIKLQNVAQWPLTGTFNTSPGVLGYRFDICLAAGTSFTAPVNNSWNSGNFLGAAGQSNFASNTAGATFDIAFAQHQPGVVCSYPVDLPFPQNLEDCTRYYCKSHPFNTAPGAVAVGGISAIMTATGSQVVAPVQFAKRMMATPTVLGYNPTTGSVNTVAGPLTPQAITGVISASDMGFGGFALSSVAVAGVYNFHYTADTGT